MDSFEDTKGILDPRQVFSELVERVGASFLSPKHQVILNGLVRYGPISASGLKENLSVTWSPDAIKKDIEAIMGDKYILEEDGKYRIDCLQFIHVVILKCDLIGEEMSDRLRKIQETSQIIHKCEKLECGFEVADPFVHSRCQRNENGDFLCRKCGGKLVKMGISPEYAQAIERNAMLQERLHVIHESLKQLSEFYVELEKSDVKEGFITRKEYRSRTNQLDMKTKEGISLRVVVEVNCDPLPPRRRSKGRGVKKEPEVDKEESEECGQMDADDAMAEEPLDGNGGGDGPKDDAFMLVEEDAELSSGSFDENEFWNPFEKKERPEEDPMEEEEEGGEKDVKKGNSDGLFPTIKKEQEEQ